MIKRILVMVCFLGIVVSSFADESRNLSLRTVLPRIGAFRLGEVEVAIIPAPIAKIPDQPKEALVIPDDRKEEWRVDVERRWLRIELKKPTVIEFRTGSLASYHAMYSRSLYISPKSDDDRVFGKLVGTGLAAVAFRYFTINVDANESEKIETERNALTELGKNRKGLKLRGKIVRIETSAMHLFSPGTQKIDFLDFYIKDVEFVKY